MDSCRPCTFWNTLGTGYCPLPVGLVPLLVLGGLVLLWVLSMLLSMLIRRKPPVFNQKFKLSQKQKN
jgi:hypothetical protein